MKVPIQKSCSDRDLPIWTIWLLRKRRELRGTIWEIIGYRILEQATDALNDPEDYGICDNLSLEDLCAEMTEEGL